MTPQDSRKLILSFLTAASVFVLGPSASSALAQTTQGLFLCCTLRYEMVANGNRASDANWGEWRNVLSPGTSVSVSGSSWDPRYGRNSASNTFALRTRGALVHLRNDYNRDLDQDAFLARFVTTENPLKKLYSFPEAIRTAINQGRVMKGMTREQTLMALGYPYPKETPSLESTKWIYYWGSFDSISVVFDENGLVQGVTGLPFALKDMLYESKPGLVGQPLPPMHTAERLSNLDERGKDVYIAWLTRPLPRAFALDSTGKFFASAWNPGATPGKAARSSLEVQAHALTLCASRAKAECTLYAIDHELFTASK